MTFKIERLPRGDKELFLHLSGRIQSEDLRTLKQAIEDEPSDIVLDLTEVMLVDREVAMFFAACELKGIELRNSPAFVSKWIAEEKLQMRARSQKAESKQ